MVGRRARSWAVAVAVVAGLGVAGSAQADDASDERALIERIAPSVVRLSMRSGREEVGNGTGFFVRSDGVVVTNFHVVSHIEDRLVAKLRDGRELAVLGLLATDEQHDLALLRVEGSGHPALPLAPSASVQVGEAVTLVGSPLGFDQSASAGIVAAVRDDFPKELREHEQDEDDKTTGPLVQHTAANAPGASGSPLVDRDGRVIGVNHSMMRGTNISFGAHVDSLRALLDHTQLDAPPQPLGPKVRRNLLISAGFFLAVALVIGVPLVLRRPRRRAYDA